VLAPDASGVFGGGNLTLAYSESKQIPDRFTYVAAVAAQAYTYTITATDSGG